MLVYICTKYMLLQDMQLLPSRSGLCAAGWTYVSVDTKVITDMTATTFPGSM